MGEPILIQVHPEIEHKAEEAECANMHLNDLGVPKGDDGGKFSLVGRIKALTASFMGGPKQRTLTQLQPGNIIEWRDEHFGCHRRWRVHGTCYGAVNQESVICIEAIDRAPAWDEIDLPLMWVPTCLLRQCRIAGHDFDWMERNRKGPRA